MFSVIILFNELRKEIIIKKFFSKLSSSLRNQKEIEVIFIVENDYKLINYIQNFQNANPNCIVKFIFSNRENSLNKILEQVNKLVTNDYLFFLTSPSKIVPGFFNTITKIIDSNSPDIIEFKPSLNNFIKWNPKDRLTTNKYNVNLRIKEHPEIIAFSYPFIFNKIISTSLLNTVLKFFSTDTMYDTSNILFTYLVYLLFLKANKYYYLPNQLISIDIEEKHILNYNSILSQWDVIQEKYSIENKYLEEISYAKLFYLKIILCSLYLQNKTNIKEKLKSKKYTSNLIQQKYQEKLDQITYSEFKDFHLKNKYMLLPNSIEANILKQNYPISKWNKLLKELEI